MALFAGLLAEEGFSKHLDPARRAEMAELIRGLCVQYASDMAAVVAALPEQHRIWLSANVVL